MARKLIAALSLAGFTVWNPDDEIYPGDNWAKKIGQAMEESDLMVALVTRSALESGSLQHDVQFALTSKSYRSRVIPVLIDFPAFVAGHDVPWILLKLDPVYIESSNPNLNQVVQRVRSLAETECNAAR